MPYDTPNPPQVDGGYHYLFTLPAGRLVVGDTLFVDGMRYGEIEHVDPIEIPRGEPGTPYGMAVGLRFVTEGPATSDQPWAVVRFLAERVTAVLANNLPERAEPGPGQPTHPRAPQGA